MRNEHVPEVGKTYLAEPLPESEGMVTLESGMWSSYMEFPAPRAKGGRASIAWYRQSPTSVGYSNVSNWNPLAEFKRVSGNIVAKIPEVRVEEVADDRLRDEVVVSYPSVLGFRRTKTIGLDEFNLTYKPAP